MKLMSKQMNYHGCSVRAKSLKYLSFQIFCIIASLLFTLPSEAEEKAEPAASSVQHGLKYAVDIPLDILKLKLEPLTVEELKEEAETWQQVVQKSAQSVAEAAIKSRNAEDKSVEKKEAIANLIANRELVVARVKRLRLVLDQWEIKGGDPATLRKYADAVSMGGVNVEDSASVNELIRRQINSKEIWGEFGEKATIFTIILLVSWGVGQLMKWGVSVFFSRQKAGSELLAKFVKKMTARCVFIVGFLIGLSYLGVNVGAMVALIGGASFIIGFALQDTLSNFANGMMVLMYRPFDEGDIVEIGGVNGTVESVSLVNTMIKTLDNQVILVPNKSVWGQVIINRTASLQRRVDMTFGIGYSDDIEKAQAVLERIVREHELTLSEPQPIIQVHELADSSVNFVCRPWTNTANYWQVYWDITKRVKLEFDANGISIPFPQQDVHLHRIENT